MNVIQGKLQPECLNSMQNFQWVKSRKKLEYEKHIPEIPFHSPFLKYIQLWKFQTVPFTQSINVLQKSIK